MKPHPNVLLRTLRDLDAPAESAAIVGTAPTLLMGNVRNALTRSHSAGWQAPSSDLSPRLGSSVGHVIGRAVRPARQDPR